jgi:hypothetical protein
MIQEEFDSVDGFNDDSDTPKTYKELLKHKNQTEWWE